MKIIATALIKQRSLKGFSIAKLSEKSGVSQTTIIQMEHGNTKGSTITIGKLAHALNVTVEDISQIQVFSK